MSKKMLFLIISLGVFAGSASADLVGYWPFDEGSGAVAEDGSGNGNNGEIINATWTAGQLGSALSFDGTAYVDVPPACWATVSDEVTLAFWINIPAANLVQSNFIMAAFSDPADNGARVFSCHLPWAGNTVYFDTSGPGYDRTSQAVPASDLVDAWSHWAFVKNAVTGDATIYRNGVQWHSATGLNKPLQGADITKFTIGTKASLAEGWYTGMIDDVQLYDHALTQEEVVVAMAGIVTDIASAPTPAEDQIDVLRDVVLAWTPGETAVTRNVYLGTNLEDVTNSSANVLVGDSISPTTLDAGVLNYGATYYWRVDEVNGAPDRTVFTGDVWSFTVEPTGIPVENITATASGANPDMGPEKTIDGSGMNDMDQHSAMPTDMWLTVTGGSWIQYEFDKAYKLHEMLIWNSNQVIEAFIGFGVKEATIETSLDGENWTALDGVGELAKAPGAPTYVANNAIAMGGVTAKYVKLSVISAQGLTGQSGLSEVRFLALPVIAREPQPADGVTTANSTVELGWRSGREAVSHDIYLSTDPANLALIATTTDASLITDPLDYMTTYFWSVTEVNDAEVPTAQPGDVWSFSTPEYATVDDFESYSENEGEEVYMAWFDGFGGDASLGGSITGHIDAPFVETAVVYDGGQSMPIFIDNDGGFANIDGQVSAPNFSEVVRELDSQDWTVSKITSLSLAFQGATTNTGSGQLYIKINSTRVDYPGDAADLAAGMWVPWIIDLSAVGGNLQSVKELAIGVDGAGFVGTLYIDAIRLYPRAIEYITPVAPDTSGQLANYQFEGSANDSSAGGNHGVAEGDATYSAGMDGQALSLDGDYDYIQIATNDDLKLRSTGTFTVTASVNANDLTDELQMILLHGLGCSSWGSWYMSIGGSENNEVPNMFAFGVRASNGGANSRVEAGAVAGEWVDLVATYDGAQLSLFVNGRMADTVAVADLPFESVEDLYIGGDPGCGGRSFYSGLVDNVVIYDHAMTPGEVAGMAGLTEPIAKPF